MKRGPQRGADGVLAEELERRAQLLRENGLTLAVIAAALGVSPAWVRRHSTPNRNRGRGVPKGVRPAPRIPRQQYSSDCGEQSWWTAEHERRSQHWRSQPVSDTERHTSSSGEYVYSLDSVLLRVRDELEDVCGYDIADIQLRRDRDGERVVVRATESDDQPWYDEPGPEEAWPKPLSDYRLASVIAAQWHRRGELTPIGLREILTAGSRRMRSRRHPHSPEVRKRIASKMHDRLTMARARQGFGRAVVGWSKMHICPERKWIQERERERGRRSAVDSQSHSPVNSSTDAETENDEL